LFFNNIHIFDIFDYLDPRLSGQFRLVSTIPDNRGSTVKQIYWQIFATKTHAYMSHKIMNNI